MMTPYTDERPLPPPVFRIELLPGQVRGLDRAAQIDVVLESLVQRDRAAALSISLVCVATNATEGVVGARLFTRDRLLGVEPVLDDASVDGIIGLARRVLEARLSQPRRA